MREIRSHATRRPFAAAVLEANLLEDADRLLRQTVAATARLAAATPPSLGRTLREAAARTQAEAVAACGEANPRRALRRVAATDHGLRRFATWIDLAERFGDLPTDAALELLETQSRLLVGLEELLAGWCRRRGGAPHPAPEAPPTHSAIELVVPPPSGRGGALPCDAAPAGG